MPRSDRARSQQCPRCRGPVLRALVGRVAALDTRADPWPVTPEIERLALAQGRLTWCLVQPSYGPPRLQWRGPEHAASGRCTHAVVADHACFTNTAQAEGISHAA